MADNGKDPNIKVNIDGDITGLKKAAGDAKPVLDGLGKDAKAAGDAGAESAGKIDLMSLATSRMGVAIGGAATMITGYVASQAALIAQHIELASTTQDLTQRYGISAEELSSMSIGMVTGSTNAQQLGQGMKFLSGKMLEANSGNKEAVGLFRALGVEWADSEGRLKPLNVMIEEISSRFELMNDGAGKNALAVKTLGRAGEELIPYLNQGGDALREMRKEAEALGLVISTKTAKDANDFANNLKVLKMGAGGLAREMAGPLVEALADVTDAIRRARKEGDGWFVSAIKGARELAIALATVKPKDELAQLKTMEEQQRAYVKRLESAMRDGTMSLDDKTLTPYQRAQAQRKLLNASDLHQAAVQNLGDNIARQGQIGNYFEAIDTTKAKTDAPNPKPQVVRTVSTGGRAAPVDREAQNAIQQLTERLAVLNGEKTETEKLDRMLERSTKGWSEALIAQARRIAGEFDQREQLNAETELELKAHMKRLQLQDAAEEKANAQVEAIKKEAQAVRESVDPWLRYSREVGRLRELVDEGRISWDEYYAAATQAREKITSQVTKTKEDSDDIGALIRDAVQSSSRSISRDLAAMAFDGTKSFKTLGEAARNFAQELVAIQIQKRMMDPLLKAGTGLIDGLFKSSGAVENSFDSGAMATVLQLPGRASGGRVSSGRAYMVGEEGPEPFVPDQDGTIYPNGTRLGGVQMRVNIHEAPGTRASVQQSTGANGAPQLDVMIEMVEDAIGGRIDRGQGLAPRLESRYGLNRAAGATR